LARLNVPVTIALLGNVIQHFEYALFGLSGAIIVKIFFPQGDMLDKLIWFYTILLVSVLFKPLGSYIFGRIGDIYGRPKSFKIGMLISALSTLLIGLIPSFEQIGYLSIALLVISRVSLIMTGQIDNVTIYVTESISKNHTNFASGLISLSLQTGIFIASLAFYISDYYKIELLWRINFIISGVMGLVILSFRHKLTESKEFQESQIREIKKPLESIFTIIKNNRVNFTKAIILHGTIGGIYNFYLLFFLNYISQLTNIANQQSANLSINIGVGCCAILAPLAGFLADKYNRNKQIFYFIIINLVILLVNIILIATNHYSVIIQIILMCIYPFFVVPIIVYMKELFDVKVRMRLYGLSHTIGSTLISTSVPLISTLIYKSTSIQIAPVIYLVSLNILLLIFCPKK